MCSGLWAVKGWNVGGRASEIPVRGVMKRFGVKGLNKLHRTK